MTLTTHAITGAAVASLLPANPLLSFAAGVASHYLLDTIPHWQYKLLSETKGGSDMDADMRLGWFFVIDLFRVGTDFLFGVLLVLIFFQPEFSIANNIWWGMIGGVLPDPLQFAYFKYRHEPLISLYRLHNWFHSNDNSLLNRPISGIIRQLIIVLIVLALAYVRYLIS